MTIFFVSSKTDVYTSVFRNTYYRTLSVRRKINLFICFVSLHFDIFGYKLLANKTNLFSFVYIIVNKLTKQNQFVSMSLKLKKNVFSVGFIQKNSHQNKIHLFAFKFGYLLCDRIRVIFQINLSTRMHFKIS